jgi:hypothetical protein
MRGLKPFVLMVTCAGLLALGAAPAGAATQPTLKQAFAPLNVKIKKIGTDIGSALKATSNQTDVQAAAQFKLLAQRGAVLTIAVTKLKGAKGTTLVTQRQLALALARGATDLANISSAAKAHNATKAKAATLALIKDSPPITTARTKLAKALGIKP